MHLIRLNSLLLVVVCLAPGHVGCPRQGPSADEPAAAQIARVPSRPRPVIVVQAKYPGANAHEVERLIAAPLEVTIFGLEDLVSTISQSASDGSYRLLLTFKRGTDLKIAQVMVQNRLNSAIPAVPNEVQRLGLTIKRESPGVLLLVALYSPDASRETPFLGSFAAIQIRDELMRLPGVADVALLGTADPGMQIWIDKEKLEASGLSAADVARAIKDRESEAGLLRDPQRGLDRIHELVLKAGPGGRAVRLRDVAALELGGRSNGQFARLDGKPVVVLAIAITPEARPQEVSTAVRQHLAQLKQTFPQGMDYTVTFDPTPGAGRRDGQPLEYVVAEPRLPEGASPERVGQILERCAKAVRLTPGVSHVLELSENPVGRFPGGPCLLVSIAAAKQGQQPIRSLVRTELEKAAGGEARLCDLGTPAGLPPFTYPIDLAVHGPEVEMVRELADKLALRLARTGKLPDVTTGPGGKPARQLSVEVNRAATLAAGVAMADLSSTLAVYLGSLSIGDQSGLGRSWLARLQVAPGPRDSVEDIKRLKIRTTTGNLVPLSSLAAVREVSAPGIITRWNGRPMTEISANLASGISLAEARGLCETLLGEVRRELGLSPEYQLAWLEEMPPAKQPPAGHQAKGAAAPPLEVEVSRPLVREITDYEEFTGRLEAGARVDIRPRVTGALDKALFREGADVRQGELLFTIDPRPYQAALDRSAAQVQAAEARHKLAAADAARARKMAEATPGSVSQQELDRYATQEGAARAELVAARAVLGSDRLNLAFTRIAAPIGGRIGRRLVDPGNLVKADDTLLATIVSLDPIHAYFDVDERTLLRLHHMARERKTKLTGLPASLGVADEKGYPHSGMVDFVDNRVAPDTGTVRMRAVFPNPGGVLTPGLFARLRLPVSAPHKAVLVPEEAIGTDQGQKFVYVVNDRNEAVSRRVVVGTLQEERFRVIEKGLEPGERVVVDGWKRLGPKTIVKPREPKEDSR
jgi:RND family efflux transporter MFP subunit